MLLVNISAGTPTVWKTKSFKSNVEGTNAGLEEDQEQIRTRKSEDQVCKSLGFNGGTDGGGTDLLPVGLDNEHTQQADRLGQGKQNWNLKNPKNLRRKTRRSYKERRYRPSKNRTKGKEDRTAAVAERRLVRSQAW